MRRLINWLMGRTPSRDEPAFSPEEVREATRSLHDAAEKIKPKGSGQWRDVKRALADMNDAVNRYEDTR